jgi:hypothetical protein
LLQGSIKLIEFLLGFEDSLKLVISLLLLLLVLSLELFVLGLRLFSNFIYKVIVVMNTLKLGLHLSKLMLNTIHLYTSVISFLSDFTSLLFLLAELKVDSLVLIGKLFSESSLESSHERMVSWKITNITSIIEVVIDISIILVGVSLTKITGIEHAVGVDRLVVIIIHVGIVASHELGIDLGVRVNLILIRINIIHLELLL